MISWNTAVGAQEWLAHVVEIGALLAGTSFVLGWIRHALGEGWIRLALGRRDAVGLAYGALLGAVTPVCSCSVGAIYASLLHHGASHRSAAAFLFAAPAVNEVVLVTVLIAFGWKGALWYLAGGLAAAIVTGRFAEQLRLRPCERHLHVLACTPTMRQAAWRRASADTLRLLRTMALPVVIGAGLAGALQAAQFDPRSLLAAIGAAPWAPVAAAAIGLPLHIEPGLLAGLLAPVIGTGLAMGTLISFTMATAVASVPEGALLRSLIGWRGLATLSLWYFTYTAGFGLFVNAFWT